MAIFWYFFATIWLKRFVIRSIPKLSEANNISNTVSEVLDALTFILYKAMLLASGDLSIERMTNLFN